MSLHEKKILMAMELSKKNWKLQFGDGSHLRQRTIPARSETMLMQEVMLAKEKMGLPADAPVVSCYEAGRDGFWIDRMLRKHGITNYVMDPASIEVPRRARQRKTDSIDAEKLLDLLMRAEMWGQRKAFSVVRVPTEEQESAMRLARERKRLSKERTAHRARMRSLLVLHGIEIGDPGKAALETLRDWEGKPVPTPLVDELNREQKRLRMAEDQMDAIEEQQKAIMEAETPVAQKVRKLCRLKAVGQQSSWLLVNECLGWRNFKNRRQLGSFAGLTGTPYDSGDTLRELGISKAGNGRVRTTMIELAWLWVRWQPKSALTCWFMDRYVRNGTRRCRRKGIVALARKLLVALWKYLEQDLVPEGAILRA